MAARSSTGHSQPLLVKSDLDGFLGLAIDNLIQFLLILGLCRGLLGFSSELILGRVLPGAALSLLVGNVYYALQARRVARETGRDDVTALPYGINTVSLFAYVFLVMMPVKQAAATAGLDPEQQATLAWQAGLVACLVSGVIEVLGAFVADWIRRVTPRAALLSTLAGIAISFISIDFALRTFEAPLVALLPLAIILATYFAGLRMPFGIPGGIWAVLAGTAAAWICYLINASTGAQLPTPVDPANLKASFDIGFHLPIPVLGDLVAGFTDPVSRATILPLVVSVMVPMGLFNVLGSLQNLESAEAAGDVFPTRPSLIMNGTGTLVAAAFGSCFPTTIYIGHPGWKAMGARSGYSLVNGIVFALVAVLGLMSTIAAIVPLEAGIAIVLYIGIVITAQAFQATPHAHAPAVAIGLFPAIAGWGALMVQLTLVSAGMTKADSFVGDRPFFDSVLHGHYVQLQIKGLVALASGFMLTSMVWSSMAAHLIDKQFRKALWWALAAAVLSLLGFMHAGALTHDGLVQTIGDGSGWPWAVGYLLVGGFIGLLAASRDSAA